MTGPAWRSAMRLLVAHPTDAAVLLLDAGDGPALPAVTVAERVWTGEPAAIVEAARDRCGLAVHVLFGLRDTVAEEARTVDGALVAETVDGAVPAGGIWVGADRLDAVPEVDRALVAETLNRLDAPGQPPWATRGWTAGAGDWLRDAASAAGRTPTGPVEQVRTWALSAVVRVPTTDGYLYLKVAARMPLFADEPAVTGVLAAMFPQAVPTPVATDPDRGWLALADFGAPLGWETPKEARIALVRDFARLQIASVDRVGELAAAGCVDRRLDRLAALDVEWAVGKARRLLTDEECARLRAALATLPARCAELAAHRMPDALLHGDMHPGNATVSPGGHRFFDWTDAAIGHPFLDMFLIAEEEDATIAAALRAAYLDEWSAYTGTDPSAAWDAAAVLIPAYHSVSYLSITSALDPPDPEMDGGARGFLRRYLAAEAANPLPIPDISVLAGSEADRR